MRHFSTHLPARVWMLLLIAALGTAVLAAACDDDDDSSDDSDGQVSDQMDDHAEDGHTHEDDRPTHEDSVEAPERMTVAILATPDAASGINVRIDITAFGFTPEPVNREHVRGEGHAHVYLDGVKLRRVSGPDPRARRPRG